MIEDLPIISINVKILKFWSFILVHNWRRYISLIPSIFLNITQFLDMYFSNEPIDSIIRNVYFLVLWFNTVIRALFLIANRRKFEIFMENLEYMYYEIKKDGEKPIVSLLDEMTKTARRLSIFNLFLGVLVSTGFVLYPLFSNERALPFGITIPGVDKYAEPAYGIIYTWQVIITPMGCCMYIPFTSIVVGYMMFGTVASHYLQHRLRRLRERGDTDKIVMMKIVWCIQYHWRLMRYTTKLNDLVTYIALLEFLTFGATICALLFLLNIVKTFEEMFIVSTYILMIIMQLFTLYWYADELSVQSLRMAVAAYDSSWLDFKVPARKALVLIILRTQKPLMLKVGNVYPMTMQTFQSVLNAAYSFFTILRRMYV
ncbi:odorant receptor 30a-like [Hermetia illucens]|uniref:odorant receptor 30a-like n=1 Tax=Hermetia illucens TaxID=343691 RepID=UPI0018CC79B7|nr:odorant receptor 30a-like [Hermetia illucens]